MSCRLSSPSNASSPRSCSITVVERYTRPSPAAVHTHSRQTTLRATGVTASTVRQLLPARGECRLRALQPRRRDKCKDGPRSVCPRSNDHTGRRRAVCAVVRVECMGQLKPFHHISGILGHSAPQILDCIEPLPSHGDS
jgi:hypothetical protein